MKRLGNVFNKICDMDNLVLAHQNASKDKSFYKEVKMVNSDKTAMLSLIKEMLLSGEYAVYPSDYTISTINDGGKERQICKLSYYPHRIVQWAIMLQIGEVFIKTFTDFSCASVPNRGIHKAYKLTQKYLKDYDGTKYCLKMDVRHFYPSIDRDILKRMLRKKIKDKNVLSLLDMIIDSCPTSGLPIGSYLSQYLANYYLSFFDHWLKEEMKIRYVIRYMDDIVIFGNNKEELHALLNEIRNYLTRNLKLKLKDNWQIFPTRIRGVDFVGYRFFDSYTLLRKKTCKRIKRKCRKIKKKSDGNMLINYSEFCSVNSYKGWLKWCDSYRLCDKYITPINKSTEEYYKRVIKHEDYKQRKRNE